MTKILKSFHSFLIGLQRGGSKERTKWLRLRVVDLAEGEGHEEPAGFVEASIPVNVIMLIPGRLKLLDVWEPRVALW